MNDSPINNLLDLVGQIRRKYDEISRITGRDYNIFDILQLSTQEVRLHSNIIAQLLSPKGSHGQGTRYLDLFFKVLKEKLDSNIDSNSKYKNTLSNIDSKTVTVEVEKHIGSQTIEEGGRLDIILQDRYGNTIIIENKIYASDQRNQLLRYHNYNKNAVLVYLTLWGDEPTEESLGGKTIEEMELLMLSYSDDITNWLELCLKESFQLPVIRETVFQYLKTINKLTNQNEYKDMETEIVNLLTENRSKFDSAVLIEKSIREAKKLLLMRFGEQLKIALDVKYKNTAMIELNENFGSQYAGIKVYPPNIEHVFFQISFLRENSEFYLEIFNRNNIENGAVKAVKGQENIQFYKERLNKRFTELGNKVENVTKSWQGDWVARYHMLDAYFTSGGGWGDLADKNYEMVTVVIEQLTLVIDAMLERVVAK